MSNVVAIIPARSGSKGVQDKNIKLLDGRPLLAYSIAAARKSACIERIIVSTDSEHYGNVAKKCGAEVPFLRPSEISGDNSTDYEWIKHLLDWMLEKDGIIPSYLVHLRPTTPFRDPTHIDSAIECLKQNDNATALRSSHEMIQSSYKTLEIEGNYYRCIGGGIGLLDLDAANRPRQEFKKTYDPNGYVDVYKSHYVMENKKLLGDRVLAYITPRVAEVDTLEELNFLEYQLSKKTGMVSVLFE